MKNLKNSLLLLFISSSLFSQVAIGKSNVDGDGLVDFGSEPKGIILPKVTSLTTQEGSIVFDAIENRVKYYNDSSWVDLSTATGTSEITDQTLHEEIGDGTIVGANTSNATGVLILESIDKALILPKVASPQLNIATPAPGTICYDSTSNMLAVYNGKQWAFWDIE